MTWRGEVCKRCRRRNVVGFVVPDATWAEVTQGRWNILCPTCFDEVAEERGVAYTLRELSPVSWWDWL